MKAGGTFLNYLLESRRNLILFSKGNIGFAFGNGIMSYADGTGEGPSLAEGPSPEGPLAEEHKPPLTTVSGQDMHCTASRGPRCVSRNMRKSPCGTFFGLRRRSKRAYTRRVDEKRKINFTFAHIFRFSTFVPPERYDQKFVRVLPIQYGCRPDDFCFHRSGGMSV